MTREEKVIINVAYMMARSTKTS